MFVLLVQIILILVLLKVVQTFFSIVFVKHWSSNVVMLRHWDSNWKPASCVQRRCGKSWKHPNTSRVWTEECHQCEGQADNISLSVSEEKSSKQNLSVTASRCVCVCDKTSRVSEENHNQQYVQFISACVCVCVRDTLIISAIPSTADSQSPDPHTVM